jgi:hypothetical protein
MPCKNTVLTYYLMIYNLCGCHSGFFFFFADEDCDSGEANAYFVLEGRCICLQRLHVRRTTAIGSGGFALVTKRHDGEDKEQSVGRNVRTVYVKMSDLRPGSVFGLGKNCSNQIYYCLSKVPNLKLVGVTTLQLVPDIKYQEQKVVCIK